MTPRWIRPLFIVAALYDILLGAAYFLVYPSLYAHFGIELPNHPGYVQLNALFVTIMGVGFWMVANAPARNRDLIALGSLFKVAYAGIVFVYWARGLMPSMWLIWAVCDTLFLVAFLAALRALPKAEPPRG
jgi:hypothetical protein